MHVRLAHDQITIGNLSIAFHRTLRIPDDGRHYPLPPSLGHFPVHRVEDYAERVPQPWRAHGGVFIPMYQREAAWLSFSAPYWGPQALKVAVGMVNAVSGEPWSERIVGGGDDYLVCPPQPWLDGINAGDGVVRQFVAMPLGMGYTVEGQVSGDERFGGIQLVSFAPKPGVFPDAPPPLERTFEGYAPLAASAPASAGAEMGIAAGGRMEQAIYPDPHGPDTWDNATTGRVYVHIVNSMVYEQITGGKAPDTPVTARTYAEHGYPWFDLYDEQLGDIDPSEALAGVRSIKEMDAAKGFKPQQDDDPVHVPDHLVRNLHIPKPGKRKDVVADGDWSR